MRAPTAQRTLRPRSAPAAAAPASGSPAARRAPLPRPTGRLLIVHANGKEYGRGAGGSKASNREFPFAVADYVAMRDSGVPYSGDPRKNKLIPLPRPTYTEFINRARAARMLDRLDFLYVPAEAPQPPPWRSFEPYERVVWCGVSFRRFARLWTPERHHFFQPSFQARVFAVLCCALRQRTTLPSSTAALASLPTDLLHVILAASAGEGDSRRDGYDDMAAVESGCQHLFLPAPGSAGVREALFDGVFGL
mmetsp:Transcript_31499/g.104220  ORF Transcript_31499/g.104220 Transcript_31499/m.104220 type:complete len:250 (-) Transcript_31499:233-982(-)